MKRSFVDTKYKIYDVEKELYLCGSRHRKGVATEKKGQLSQWEWNWVSDSSIRNTHVCKVEFSNALLYFIRSLLVVEGGPGLGSLESALKRRDNIIYFDVLRMFVMLQIKLESLDYGKHEIGEDTGNIWFIPVDGMGRSERVIDLLS